MKFTTVAALAPFFASALAAPAPLDLLKRDIVWKTVTSEIIDTVVITTTIWVQPEAVPTPGSAQTTPPPAALQLTTSTTAALAASPPPVASPPAASPPAVSPPAASPPAASPPAASPPVTSAPAAVPTAAAGAMYPVVTLTSAIVADGPCTPGSPCSGDATYYSPGLGACGITNNDNDMIVAIGVGMMGSLSNGLQTNPMCGRKILLQPLAAGGKATVATITDKCEGCLGPQDVDMSPAVFGALGGTVAHGRYVGGAVWHYV